MSFGQPELFSQVVSFISGKMMPIVRRHAISGAALNNTEDTLLDNPTALAMLIDCFPSAVFHAVVTSTASSVRSMSTSPRRSHVPDEKVYRIQVRFQGSEIRRG